MDCLFCKFVDKSIPVELIHEDEHVVAFNDIAPQAPKHFLVVPKQHVSTLNDITDDNSYLIGHMAKVAAKVAADKGIASDGFRTVMNCNASGGQTVFHIHMHVLGGRQMTWPPG